LNRKGHLGFVHVGVEVEKKAISTGISLLSCRPLQNLTLFLFLFFLNNLNQGRKCKYILTYKTIQSINTTQSLFETRPVWHTDLNMLSAYICIFNLVA